MIHLGEEDSTPSMTERFYADAPSPWFWADRNGPLEVPVEQQPPSAANPGRDFRWTSPKSADEMTCARCRPRPAFLPDVDAANKACTATIVCGKSSPSHLERIHYFCRDHFFNRASLHGLPLHLALTARLWAGNFGLVALPRTCAPRLLRNPSEEQPVIRSFQ